MPRIVPIGCLLVVMLLGTGCRTGRHTSVPVAEQVRLQEVWELGRPISDMFGYAKGVHFQQYVQILFYNDGTYDRRSTTLVAQGFSRRWGTGDTSGKWKPDAGADGMPMLLGADGTYQRLDALYPPPKPVDARYMDKRRLALMTIRRVYKFGSDAASGDSQRAGPPIPADEIRREDKPKPKPETDSDQDFGLGLERD